MWRVRHHPQHNVVDGPIAFSKSVYSLMDGVRWVGHIKLHTQLCPSIQEIMGMGAYMVIHLARSLQDQAVNIYK